MGFHVIFEPDDNDTLLVTCPDLPEVTSFGEDEEAACFHAAGAIEAALQGRILGRQEVPEPRFRGGVDIPLSPLVAAKVGFYRAFLASGLSKAELGRRLRWHGPSVDRLFDLGHDSRISQIGAAAKVLGSELDIAVKPAA